MAPPLKSEIVKITEESYLDSLGKPVRVVNVRFKVGDHGPFTATIPREVFSTEVANRAIQPTVDTINGLLK
jgi:hypothetical protein